MKANDAINTIIGGLQSLTVGVQLTTTVIGLIQAARPDLDPLDDLEVARRYAVAAHQEHDAVLADQQRLDADE